MDAEKSSGSQGSGSDWQADRPTEEQQLRAQLFSQRQGGPANGGQALNDPFLSHTPGAQPSGRTPVQGNFYGQRPGGLGDPEQDPFAEYNAARTPDFAAAAAGLGQKLTLEHFLGPGDSTRHPTTFRTFVLIPWLVYVWVLWLWLFLRHYSLEAAMVLTSAILLGCAVMVALGSMRGRWAAMPVSLPMLGLFCLLAAMAATYSSNGLWQNGWREYWWTQTGMRFKDKNGTTPARSVGDAATIAFESNSGDPTYVAYNRSAGYMDGRIYCAAPVLQSSVSEASLLRVNYWAIGMDCCDLYGAFRCDAARTVNGSHAVVVRSGTFPCDDCRPELFDQAVRKAEAAFGLASARGALMVRWVTDQESVISDMESKGLLDLLISAISALSGLTVVTFFIWYYGALPLAPAKRSKAAPLLPLAPSSHFFTKKKSPEEIAAEAYAGYQTFNAGSSGGHGQRYGNAEPLSMLG